MPERAVVGGFIDPYSFTGIKCDGIGGLWFLNVIGQFEGVQTGGDTAQLVIEAQISGAPTSGGGTLQLARTSCE